MAELSRDKLADKILNKTVKLKNVNTEKYGEVADVYCDDICMSDWMLSQNLAVPYDGGKKRNKLEIIFKIACKMKLYYL